MLYLFDINFLVLAGIFEIRVKTVYRDLFEQRGEGPLQKVATKMGEV